MLLLHFSLFVSLSSPTSLNTTDNAAAARSNHSVTFDLLLQNGMKDKGVNYAAINMTFSYYQNNSRLPIANYTLPGFYQGHGKKARRKTLVNVTRVPWPAAFGAVSAGSTVKFRVDLATRVKYKIMFWYTKRHTVAVGGDVEVGSGGWKVKRKPIKMKSGVPDPRRHWVRVGAVAFLTLFIILLL